MLNPKCISIVRVVMNSGVEIDMVVCPTRSKQFRDYLIKLIKEFEMLTVEDERGDVYFIRSNEIALVYITL